MARFEATPAGRFWATADTFITDAHAKRLAKLTGRIEARLEALAVDWLVERFRALPQSSKRKFLQIVSRMLDEA